MRLLTALCALIMLTGRPPAAQPEWRDWDSCKEVSKGAWTWTAPDGAQTHVGIEQPMAGIFRITVAPQGPQVEEAHDAQVRAGAISLGGGIPELTFQMQQGKLRCLIPAAEGERFFGLGEKYNAVNQRGKRVKMWVDSGYRSLGDRTYLPVPMYLSSAGYGLYLDSSICSQFDLAGDGRSVTITNPAPRMTLYLWAEETYRDLMRAYCRITGFPEAPPEWAFGIWLSRASYSSQKEVLEVARRWRALELPLSLFNIEGWKGKSYHSFNEQSFPDPRAMIEELHEYGWRVMLWNTHNLPPTDPNYKHGDERGYFAKDSDGKTYNVGPKGYGRGGCLDVTNPEAIEWWNGLYDPLLEMGVDALFNDVTNYLDDDFKTQRAGRMVFSNGKTSEEMHNLYWLLFNKATYEYMREKTGGDTVLRVAGGWAGQQKYSTVWAGDSATTWEFLRRDIKALLSSGWSGIPYFGYDIPGFSDRGNPPSPELYIRWVQFGALSPLMQFHTTARPEPWHYGDKAIKALRTYGWLRESLLPYIYSLALEAETNGAPMARSLVWEHPDDATAAEIEDEFLLGPHLLIAPVCAPGTQRRIYLPAGGWMDIVDGSQYEGPVWIEAQAPLNHLPIYLREGSAIPVKLSPKLNVGEPLEGDFVRAVEVLPPFERGGRTSTWRWKGRRASLRCKRKGETVTFSRSGDALPAGTILRLEVGPPTEVSLDGAKLKGLSESEIAQGDKRGYCYRSREQVCFVCPGDDWREVKLTEQHGQLRFLDWDAPSRIAANAGVAHIEVSLPEGLKDDAPALVYAYRGAVDTAEGTRADAPEDNRWQFDIPLKLSPKAEDIVWAVAGRGKTRRLTESRPRVTVVEPPTQLLVPATIRLDSSGVFTVTVTSNSDFPTRGRLVLEGPQGLVLTPSRAAYDLAGKGASQDIRIAYRVTGDLGLGEHEILVRHSIAQTQMASATVLAAKPFHWRIAGPFGDPATKREDWLKAFKTPHPPEQGTVDLDAEYETPAGKVKWQPYPADWIGQDGMIDIERVYGKIDLRSAYLCATFESPTARDVLLKVGSDDALMLWLNGAKLFEYPNGRPAARDQDTIKATLKPGRNTVLAKVFDITDAWRFYFRITDLKGKPLGDLTP